MAEPAARPAPGRAGGAGRGGGRAALYRMARPAAGDHRRRGAARRDRRRAPAAGRERDHRGASHRARPPGGGGDDHGPLCQILLARPGRRGRGRRRALDRPGRHPVRPARAACPRARLRAGRPVRPARLALRTAMTDDLDEIAQRVSAARAATEARGETFYPGASRVHLAAFPPIERWDDWVELSSRAWPAREERHYMLVPTTCFNCESACGLLAYVDRDTRQVRKFEGNPEHPGSRGRNCAKGPATINQVTDPDRILYPMRRSGPRGEGRW